MNVKAKLVNKHKSATADLWHYSGAFRRGLLLRHLYTTSTSSEFLDSTGRLCSQV